jgi:AcrR family transcriptional regulator
MESEQVRPTRGLNPKKRKAILSAAGEVFLRDGFAGASMDELAAVAGVSKMTVYRHFHSKEALFEGVLSEICGDIVMGAPVPPDASLREELRILGRAFISLLGNPGRLKTYRLVMAEAERSPHISQLFYESAVLGILGFVATRIGAHAPALDTRERQETAGGFLQLTQGHEMLRLLMCIDDEINWAAFNAQIETACDFVDDRIARIAAAARS